MSITTHVFDDSDVNFKYTGQWWTGGTWTATDGHSGTLSGTNDLNGSASFTFPVGSTGFRYYGMRRSRGGLFGICVDCDFNNPSYQTIDGFEGTDSGTNDPSLLWSQTFSLASVHSITIRNDYDPRGTPPGNSELTIDRFELDVPIIPQNLDTSTLLPHAQPSPENGAGNSDNSLQATQKGGAAPMTTPLVASITRTPASSMQAVSTSASSLVTSSGFGSQQSQSQSQTDSVSQPSTTLANNSSISKTTPVGGIVGAALGSLAAIAIAIFLIFWLRNKKKGTSSVNATRPFQLLEMNTTTLDPTTIRTTVLNGPSSGWATGYVHGSHEEGGHHRPHVFSSSHPSDGANSSDPLSARLLSPSSHPLPPPTLSFYNPVSRTSAHANINSANLNSTTRRRELDAGPVPLAQRDDDDNETLPPDYAQLFSVREFEPVRPLR